MASNQNKDDIIRALTQENEGLKEKLSKIQKVVSHATKAFKLYSLAFKSDI